jgi:hypothetical protein
MAWSPQQAARRYYRRRGDTVDGRQRLVVLNSPPGRAHEVHAAILLRLGYGFAESLFAQVHKTLHQKQ